MHEVVSIRDANQHLSRYLDRVEQGVEIIITRRGKPIARVLPSMPNRACPIPSAPPASVCASAWSAAMRWGGLASTARFSMSVIATTSPSNDARTLQRRHQHPDL